MPLFDLIVAMKDEIMARQLGFHGSSELGFKEGNIAELGSQVCLSRGTKFTRKFAVPCRQTQGSCGNIAVWCISNGGIENDYN